MFPQYNGRTIFSNPLKSKETQEEDKKTTKYDGKSSLEIEKGKLRIRIPVQNILFIRAEHVYCRIFFVNNQEILQRISVEKLLARLPAGIFLRVHRSFVVNLSWVERWTSTKVIVGGVKIPIGRTRRDEVVQCLKAE